MKAEQDELAKIRAVFRSFDKDNNGFLDEDEITAGLEKVDDDL